MRNLNSSHSLAMYPVTRVKPLVIAQAWFLSTKHRQAKAGRHVICAAVGF